MTKINAKPIKVDTPLPLYIPLPNFLVSFEISQTAKLVYGLLLGRTTLSQKNNMVDEWGNVYVVYTIEHLAMDLGRSQMTVKNALKELVKVGLLRKHRNGYRRANDLYVLIPEEADRARKLSAKGKENEPCKGKKNISVTDRKVSTNYMRKTNEKTTINNYCYEEGESF